MCNLFHEALAETNVQLSVQCPSVCVGRGGEGWSGAKTPTMKGKKEEGEEGRVKEKAKKGE